MMTNYDEIVKIDPNRNRPFILDHRLEILIAGGFWTGTTNVLLNLTARCWQNSYIRQRSIWIKVLISYRRKKISREKMKKNPNEIIVYKQFMMSLKI